MSRLEQLLLGAFQRLVSSNAILFWVLQVLGWGALFIVSTLTLTLSYNELSWTFVVYELIRSVLGILFTWPMKVYYARIWNLPILTRLAGIVIIAMLMSVAWTLVIIQAFEALTGAEIVPNDYGGWIFSAIFIFISWAAIYHGVKYYLLLQEQTKQLLSTRADTQNQLFKRSQAENQARLAKLKFLSYQLNPHFLFNTLNSIYSLIGSENNERAGKMVSQLSQFLRTSLTLGDELLIPLHKEITTLERYLEIEKTRFGNRLKTEFSIDDNSLELKMPIFLLQPLVENSIKYAISKSMEPGFIRVTSEVCDDRLIIRVEDSGVSGAHQVTAETPGIGIGLTNTRERLLVIYDDDFALDMGQSELGGIQISVNLPISTKDMSI
jgi:LytS/YehU family sensor histidine kinase